MISTWSLPGPRKLQPDRRTGPLSPATAGSGSTVPRRSAETGSTEAKHRSEMSGAGVGITAPHPEGIDSLNQALSAAEPFTEPGETILTVRSFGAGNINDTYLVTTAGRVERRFILQRLNRQVFPLPERVMANIVTLTGHVRGRLHQDLEAGGRPWVLPQVLSTRLGLDHWWAPDRSFWRALSFIDGAESCKTIQGPGQAREVGYALGRLHRLMSDLDPSRLTETLPGFHVTPGYLARFDAVTAGRTSPGSAELRWCLDFIERHREAAAVLEDAKARGLLAVRPIHGDPKVDNVMIDRATGRAIGMVDLDTVQPGLIHYDLGDCLRSACNPLGESPAHWQAVCFDLDLARALLQGYLSEARHFLTETDRDYLYDAIRLIAFELGLRFVTDHLAGDIYFKVEHHGHNLQRALVQFRLCQDIETRESAIRSLLRAAASQ